MNHVEQTHLSWAKAARCKLPAPGEAQELSASVPLGWETQGQAGIPAECLHSIVATLMEMSSGPHLSGKFQSLLCSVGVHLQTCPKLRFLLKAETKSSLQRTQNQDKPSVAAFLSYHFTGFMDRRLLNPGRHWQVTRFQKKKTLP